MRIIAGSSRGRKLISPSDSDVRPTIDRVKESMFNIINPYIRDAVILDLFSGTGNLALEAISRGAEKAYLVDNSRKSLSIIKENIELLKFQEQCTVIENDYISAIKDMKEKIDIIFLDPPYDEGFISKSLSIIEQNDILNEDGIIVAEHKNAEEMPPGNEYLEIIKSKKYGIMTITIYRKL